MASALLVISVITLGIALGEYVFYNEDEKINVAADASLAVRRLEKPYVMFMLFMGADKNIIATVHRDDVVMIYKNQKYTMPTLKEMRENYNGEHNDLIMYLKMGKEFIVLARMNNYRFHWLQDYFPSRRSSRTATDQGFVSDRTGFRAKVYFKNPGFQKGDTLVIKVKDKKNPDIWGEVNVKLE